MFWIHAYGLNSGVLEDNGHLYAKFPLGVCSFPLDIPTSSFPAMVSVRCVVESSEIPTLAIAKDAKML